MRITIRHLVANIRFSYKRFNLKAYINSSDNCLGEDTQREKKKPSHMQGHVNKAEEF